MIYIKVIRMIFILSALFLNLVIVVGYFVQPASAQQQPSIGKDPTLKVETIADGLSSPTSMAFIDKDHILVLEKEGQVRLVSNGMLQQQPILKVQVDTTSERGLLGIAMIPKKSSNGDTVFLYYTESSGGELRNRIYRYQWNGANLVNPTLILDLPALPGPNHDGGKLAIGPDGYLYTMIGDLNHRGQVQNIKNGPPPDNTGGIFRINPNDGSPANKNNPFLTEASLNKYYAYGIRNGFGLAFDPVTKNLWDTENGPTKYDEINLVRPGFNSGWQRVMGPISASGESQDELVNLPGSKYADPVFSWEDPPAITDIEFLNSSKLGDKYKNNTFVGDYNNGNLYYFEVNDDRTGIKFDNSSQAGLSDLVVNNKKELSEITFGTGFGSITDIKTGPDGLLYVLSFDSGKIYRISPSS